MSNRVPVGASDRRIDAALATWRMFDRYPIMRDRACQQQEDASPDRPPTTVATPALFGAEPALQDIHILPQLPAEFLDLLEKIR